MIYNMLLCPIVFLATKHFVIKDLAFSSPPNDPPRGTNGIYIEIANENHCLLEGQVEAKDYDTNLREGTSVHTQYKSQHGKNEQEIKSERVWCQ